MTGQQLKQICHEWMERTHRVAFPHPRLGYVTLDGFRHYPIPEFVKMVKMTKGICSICNTYEDDDGRCNCTNADNL